MNSQVIKIVFFAAIVAVFSSCSSVHNVMREPNTVVELKKNDFELSDQVSAEAQSTKVFGVDWARLFANRTSGEVYGESGSLDLADIPVVGSFFGGDMSATKGYSLYELMNAHPGYDVVFYPQYETKVKKPVLGIGFITKITTVKTTARLGRLTDND